MILFLLIFHQISFDNSKTWKLACKFNFYQATYTPTLPSTAKSIKDAFFLFGHQESVVWLENLTNNLYIRNLQLTKLDATSKKRLDDSQLFPALQPATLVSFIIYCY